MLIEEDYLILLSSDKSIKTKFVSYSLAKSVNGNSRPHKKVCKNIS